MNYDDVGIVYVIEKNDENLNYYECIDVTCGFKFNFDTGLKFVSLSKNCGFTLDYGYNKNSSLLAIGFKSIQELTYNNKRIMNIEKFIKDSKSVIGTCYFYDRFQNCFKQITDLETINFIKSSKKNNKDYDDSILNKDSDISKMYTEIKETIISQDEQIMQILTSLFKNQKVVNSEFDMDLISKLKENLLIYGSTGTGKTEILKRISNIYKIPIIIADATSLSETGYIGRSVTDMLKDLYLASDKNLKLAQKGILVIDEFDKLAEKDASRVHVSRDGVQRSLLKLLDGSDFYFDDIKFNTSKLSVVALGAFSGITKKDDYTNITTKDFVQYGIMRELMGRFSKLVFMNTLSREDIKKILLESNFSPINTYSQLFKSMNIDFTYDDSFIEYVANEAINLQSGARSLKTIFDNLISSAMFRIFTGDYSKIQLTSPQSNEKPYVLTKKIEPNIK